MVLFFLFLQTDQLPIYYTDPFLSNQGMVVTDNYRTALYLVNDGAIKEILSAPGCGRYINLVTDKKNIAFKLINDDGLQIPALFSIQDQRITALHAPVRQAGQPSFSDDGSTAFTIDDTIFIKKNNVYSKHFIGYYSNLAPISPDANYCAYNDDKDQIYILDLQTSESYCISDNIRGYFAPKWSPNSDLILYSSLDGHVFVYDLKTKETYQHGPGINPDWSPDSRAVIFHRTDFSGYLIEGAELYIAGYDGSNKIRLTNTPFRHEMDAKFIDANHIIYRVHDANQMIISRLENDRLFQMRTIAFKCLLETAAHYYNIITNLASRDSIDVPYINQVYDTPDWHNGHWSCAPTTAMMAIAYYRKLPYWDCWASSPYGHISHFGNYICAQYNYREFTYRDTARDPSDNLSWGGYGYMWYDGYSPYSRMVNYINYHDINSWTDNTPTWEETQTEVQAGYPYCMCVGLTTAGHLVLAVGQVSDWHTLIFNDPYGNKNTPGYPSYDGKYSRYDWPGYNNGYQNLNQVYWCRGARGSWQPVCDTIIDDLQYQYAGEPHGFFMYNQSPSTMRYFRDNISGFRDHMWWTYSTADADTCYVTWTPDLPQSDSYQVFAYIPDINANADARYQIHHDGGTVTVNIDQSNFSSEWVSLGSYYSTQDSAYLYLGDATGTSGQQIAFDAVRWSAANMGAHETAVDTRQGYHLQSTIVKNSLTVNASGQKQSFDLEIFDITGQCLKKVSQCPDKNMIEISVAGLPNGVYFMQLHVSGLDHSEKFIIAR